MPMYEYAARVYPWGEKIGRNIKGHVWVPSPDESLAEMRVHDLMFYRYGYVPGRDRLHDFTVTLIEDDDGMESEVNKNVVL